MAADGSLQRLAGPRWVAVLQPDIAALAPVGCLLARSGLDFDATIATLTQLRAGTKKSGHRSPESGEQHELLRWICEHRT